MIVLTVDQQGSRNDVDRVPQLLERLSGIETMAGFERTVGDEIQALVATPEQACAAIRCVLRLGGWHVGVGCGEVDASTLDELHSATIRVARGSAFVRAREAVDRAKKYPVSVSVVGPNSGAAASVQAVLQLIGIVVGGRTAAQREVVELLDRGRNGIEIAELLGISEPSVSRRRRLSNVAEEEACWPVAVKLLAELDGQSEARQSESLEVAR